MSTLSPPDMQKPCVVSTTLAGNKSDETTRKMAQRLEKTMNELAPVPDLMPNTGRKNWNKPGACGDGGEGELLFHKSASGLRESQT